ncbi:serine/threonine-protein phosphatase 6 regulatory ankyrin repeat subunit B-like [Crassostrea angulata]|uniref:Ankyrin repeat domain-containing protein 50 n=1 Tax=Magallana gigas TaxID=29159 RepID=K1PZV8_MAGGI|nr:serine/threonine-protein phosphatase 6 regulatory ankyrin repeat subunit B-like [Crassostrea angulata]|eukprot:XP_011425758.1 PREDICTED: serine/threonine-protein phosphatase 6 regulatory ankyrin repeat subunit B [Crassostrea gigas]
MFDANGEPLSFTAIVNGDMETLSFLIGHSDVNLASEDGRTALMIAVEMNDMSMVKKLIKSGARVDSKDNSGKTPLLLALENGNFNIAEYLIKHGSDVNEVDHLGQSALLFVANADCYGSSKIVKILICCGYVLKDCDSWLCLDSFTKNKTKESKYGNLIHKLKQSLKIMSNSKSKIQ